MMQRSIKAGVAGDLPLRTRLTVDGATPSAAAAVLSLCPSSAIQSSNVIIAGIVRDTHNGSQAFCAYAAEDSTGGRADSPPVKSAGSQGRQGRRTSPARATLHQLRAWREARGLSQEELADAAGLSHGTISRYENGRLSLTESPLRRLAAALRLVPWQLFVSPADESASLAARIMRLGDDQRRIVLAVIGATETQSTAPGEPGAYAASLRQAPPGEEIVSDKAMTSASGRPRSRRRRTSA